MLRRQGLNARSVQDITRAAATAGATFDKHFDNKHALATEVMKRYVVATDLSTLRDQQVPPAERLRRHLTSQAERTSSVDYGFGWLTATRASDNPAPSESAEFLAQWTEALADTIRAGQEAGEITRVHSAEALATFLIDALEGSALRARATGDPGCAKRTLDAALMALRL
ncbi:TetR family transcriptional regulator C-terminal domain-containing protein [Streptomyces sp. KS_5]|uniref:TetR family transcriptional regulator C-terminal domain-containing protein n=1 Tax=Streptomyces sp. KS_5 TaxID=1881018 RepID=UPI00089BEE18|nr:TetR family transcriptional regulator C-terminal domain-containing protein [Streptomyces sp. KS_5]SEE36182.1 transcriptional regulator, TetR family [Streptomyces sp. KS_5]